MPILFQEYELLAKSGLFDAEYYLSANPDIAALNVDPLLHYLETGCHEGRNPNRDFDTAYYLRQCQSLGETPTNALTHFLTVGASRGLNPLPSPTNGSGGQVVRSNHRNAAQAPDRLPPNGHRPPDGLLSLDVPKCIDGVADMPTLVRPAAHSTNAPADPSLFSPPSAAARCASAPIRR